MQTVVPRLEEGGGHRGHRERCCSLEAWAEVGVDGGFGGDSGHERELILYH